MRWWWYVVKVLLSNKDWVISEIMSSISEYRLCLDEIKGFREGISLAHSTVCKDIDKSIYSKNDASVRGSIITDSMMKHIRGFREFESRYSSLVGRMNNAVIRMKILRLIKSDLWSVGVEELIDTVILADIANIIEHIATEDDKDQKANMEKAIVIYGDCLINKKINYHG